MFSGTRQLTIIQQLNFRWEHTSISWKVGVIVFNYCVTYNAPSYFIAQEKKLHYAFGNHQIHGTNPIKIQKQMKFLHCLVNNRSIEFSQRLIMYSFKVAIKCHLEISGSQICSTKIVKWESYCSISNCNCLLIVSDLIMCMVYMSIPPTNYALYSLKLAKFWNYFYF